MSKVKIAGHASGSGTLTIQAPDTSSSRTITLPDATGTLLTSDGDGSSLTGIDGVPTGIITMWSGAVSAIPSGWVICDGNNSTPNLTDRFVIHADADSGGTFDVGDTGGSHTATPLGSVGTSGATTLSASQIPSHQHTYEGGNTSAQAGASWGSGYYGSSHNSGSTGGGSSHTHSGGTFTGSSTTVTPKYYALAYIMKT